MLQDLRWGFRSLFHNPGFSLMAILALSLGIGGTTTIFSVVNAVLLNPFPYENPEELVVIWERNLERNLPFMYASPPNFRDWRDLNETLQGVAAFSLGDYSITREQGALYVPGAGISSGLFEMLGVEPLMGRTFTPEEDAPGAEAVVILGFETWQSQFAARADIVGSRLIVNGRPRTVVGVMPAGFQFPPRIVIEGNEPSVRPGLWVPLAVDYSVQRSAHYITVVGRLRTGNTIEQAHDDFNRIASQLARQYPDSNQGWDVVVAPLQDQVVGEVRSQLWILLGAVAFVLLIACVNVANLLLARGSTRSREFAIRAALGASRRRILRQLLIESQLLALLGGAAGLALSAAGTHLLIRLAPTDIPRLEAVTIDTKVLFFTFLLCLATGLLFGLTPALRSFSGNLEHSLREGGRSLFESRNSNLQALLVVAEVALSLILLVGAGLLFQSFLNLRSVPPGFQMSHVLTSKVILPGSSFPDPQSWAAGFRAITRNVSSLPGIEAVGLIYDIPLGGDRQGTGFLLEGEPAERETERLVNFSIVTPGYFESMRIELLQGRLFRDTDDAESEPAIIINKTFAERYFKEGEALGHRIAPGFQTGKFRHVVGIVGDVRHNRLSDQPTPTMYVPYYDVPWARHMALVTRSRIETGAIVQSLRSAVAEVDRGIALYDIRPMSDILSDSIAQPRFAALMFALFSAIAIIMAATGIYGVISFIVSRRVQETGIRMVLGAQKRDILRLILKQGMSMVLGGVGIGVFAALLLNRFLQSFLYGISATDGFTLILVCLFLTGVALLACCFPALRASRLSPVEALRRS